MEQITTKAEALCYRKECAQGWVLSLKLTPTGSRNQDLSIFGKPTIWPTAADKLKWFWSSPHKRNFRYSNSKVFFPFISAVRIRKTKERKDLSIKKVMQPSYCLVARCLCKSSWQSFKSSRGLGLSREESRCTAMEAPGRSWASPSQGSCPTAFSIW